MSFTLWLESKVRELECNIRSSEVFDRAVPASESDLLELKKKVVLHRYLAQALERRRAEDQLESRNSRCDAYSPEPVTA